MGMCKTTGDSAARVAYRLTAPLSLGASAMGELRANSTLFRVKHVQIPGASVMKSKARRLSQAVLPPRPLPSVSCRRLSACFRGLRRLRACWVQLCGAACTANRLAQPRHPSRSSAQHSCDPKMSAALSCRCNSHALLVPCACPPVCIVSALVSGCEVSCQCGALVTCRCPCLLSCRNVRAWRAVAFTLWQRMGAV